MARQKTRRPLGRRKFLRVKPVYIEKSKKDQEIVIIPDTSQENANQVSRFTYNFTNK